MNNLPQKATSKNLPNLQIKAKTLLEFVQSDSEREVANCIYNSPRIETLGSQPDQLLALYAVVVEWRLYIGVPKNDGSNGEELAIVRDFIYQNFGFLTLSEIRLAFNYSVIGKLNDVEFFGLFSPLYVGKVLNSYLYYRKMTLAETIRRKDRNYQEELERASQPSPEKQAELTKEIFSDFYKEYKRTGEVRDIFSICYNFLRKHSLMIVTKEDVAIAEEWGKRKSAEELKKEKEKNIGVPSLIKNSDRIWARSWCVQKYFKDVDIDILLNNIKPELFINFTKTE